MKKIKGGYEIVINEGKKFIFIFLRNIVYVIDMENYKFLYKYKIISYISSVVVNVCVDCFVVKNISGKIVVFFFFSGEFLGESEMEYKEGEKIYFMDDGKNIFDIDWNGKIMILNIDIFEYKVLYDFENKLVN